MSVTDYFGYFGDTGTAVGALSVIGFSAAFHAYSFISCRTLPKKEILVLCYDGIHSSELEGFLDWFSSAPGVERMQDRSGLLIRAMSYNAALDDAKACLEFYREHENVVAPFFFRPAKTI